MAEQFNVTQSLFGFTPENVQQGLFRQAEQRAASLASAGGAAAPALFYGLRGAERAAVTPVFGQAPQVQQAANVQAIIQQVQATGVDLATAEGQIALAQELSKYPEFIGMATALRQQAAEQSQKAQLNQAQITKEYALAQKAVTEKTPAALEQADRVRLAELQAQFGMEEGARRFRAERDIAGEKKAAAGVQQTPTEKATLPGKAKLLENVETGALQAAKTNQTAEAIDRVLTSAFTGFGADAKLRASQVAQAFGVTVTGTSETEQLKQLLAQLAQGQARTLPGALSEKELAFLREAIGTPGFTVQTLRNVVNRLRKDATSSEIENQEVQNFIANNGDLNRYDFVSARKRAQQQAEQQINDREAKLRRLEELRRKQQGL
jgi:hypothetical protein